MSPAVPMSAQLAVQRLRALSVDPKLHPRGQPYLSAASGLVCANGRAYVIADDEHHLAVFRDLESPGELHRVVAGDLPRGTKARKKRKPDMETLLLLPAAGAAAQACLLALGSGSRPRRRLGTVIALGADGEPAAQAGHFDLEPIYAPLRALLREINIEGAMAIGDEFVLLNRGIDGRTENATARYRLRDLLRVIGGDASELAPTSVRRYALGAIDGVGLAFTDAAALPDGGWVFTAVAEDTSDSATDGACAGSAVGVVDAGGDLRSLRRLEGDPKVEGVDVRSAAGASAMTTLSMVTDADDPEQASWLLRAEF